MDPVVILGTDTVSAGPGGEARLPVRVRNQGRRVESYRVEVVGEPARFSHVEPASVSVLPGKEAEIAVTFRPPAGASTPTGILPFAVRATSEVGPASSAVAEGRLELVGATGLQAWADNTATAGRWAGTFRLNFANQGNAPVRLIVTAHDPAAVLNLSVRDEVVAVPPGGQASVEVRAKTRQPTLRGNPVNRVITAACHDFPFGADRPVPGQASRADDPHHRSFQLTFEQKPILSKLALLAMGLVVALVAAFVVLQFRGGDEVTLGMARPEAPSSFAAEAAGSTSIFLTWSRVPNATGYEIRRTTPEGQVSGPVLETVDAAALTFPVEGLGPGEQHCFAIQATGPEGVDSSPLSPHACATTAAAPQLAPPSNFTAVLVSGATYELQWEYPGPLDGITFTVFVDNDPLLTDVAGLFTTLDIPRRDLTYEATLAVRAVSGEQTSDSSNTQLVSVPAATGGSTTVVPTTAEAGGPGGPGGPGTGGSPGQGGATTTVGGGTTTTPPTTAPPPTPAQGAIQDLDATWASMLGGVVPSPAGASEDQQRAALASAFGVAPEQILTFSNRDTLALDPAGTPVVASAAPGERFFYVVHADQAAATTFCRDDVRCDPVLLEGAANATEGSNALILQRFEAATPLADVDEALAGARGNLGRSAIHVLDAASRDQFGQDEIILFADGFASSTDVNEFCVSAGIERCTPVVIEPD